VKYTFSLGNITCSPDGIEQPCIPVNSQYPGPTIEASESTHIVLIQLEHGINIDRRVGWVKVTVKVTVNNQLQDKGLVFAPKTHENSTGREICRTSIQ